MAESQKITINKPNVEGYIGKLWKISEPLRASSSIVKVCTAY